MESITEVLMKVKFPCQGPKCKGQQLHALEDLNTDVEPGKDLCDTCLRLIVRK